MTNIISELKNMSEIQRAAIRKKLLEVCRAWYKRGYKKGYNDALRDMEALKNGTEEI
jgi:hypothetical protein